MSAVKEPQPKPAALLCRCGRDFLKLIFDYVPLTDFYKFKFVLLRMPLAFRGYEIYANRNRFN